MLFFFGLRAHASRRTCTAVRRASKFSRRSAPSCFGIPCGPTETPIRDMSSTAINSWLHSRKYHGYHEGNLRRGLGTDWVSSIHLAQLSATLQGIASTPPAQCPSAIFMWMQCRRVSGPRPSKSQPTVLHLALRQEGMKWSANYWVWNKPRDVQVALPDADYDDEYGALDLIERHFGILRIQGQCLHPTTNILDCKLTGTLSCCSLVTLWPGHSYQTGVSGRNLWS